MQASKHFSKDAVSAYEIAAYYFPNFHRDARNEVRYGRGWTEWELLKGAQPRFSGHAQPKIPLWGYEDESIPSVMERKIAMAVEHGLSSFIFDWYWYEDRPFLARALEEGYLQAANRSDLKFALMWANHDWMDIFPLRRGQKADLVFKGAVDSDCFERLCRYVIDHYFSQPSYWKVDGCPYFSIYEMGTFLRGFGTVSAAREALERFRQLTREAGFPDLHLNMVVWQIPNLPGETLVADPRARVNDLGVDSLTSYAWIHHSRLPEFPLSPYTQALAENVQVWDHYAKTFDPPYFPNVSMGWDPSPRTEQGAPYELLGYPYTPILEGNTPTAFAAALWEARNFLEHNPKSRNILTINAWNEWTEGSYLEPDTEHGFAYLEAFRSVFGPESISG